MGRHQDELLSEIEHLRREADRLIDETLAELGAQQDRPQAPGSDCKPVHEVVAQATQTPKLAQQAQGADRFHEQRRRLDTVARQLHERLKRASSQRGDDSSGSPA